MGEQVDTYNAERVALLFGYRAVDGKFHPIKEDDGKLLTKIVDSLVPNVYDYIQLGYTGSDLTTVIYKIGGSSGMIVSTLTLAYSSGNLISVTKT